ncbi:Protein FAR1-RELATED SEQUENCE 5, partial [Cucurbita argyrosperma subsp. sororia]
MDLRDNSERCLLTVDADEGGSFESPAATELIECDGDIILEPYEGMEFESEDAAKIFYDKYARQVGFVMRVMSCRRSEKDGRILARRLGCNKEGYCVSIRGKFGAVRKPRPSTREGCKAMIHVKYDKSGKWVITKFVKEHNHPLVVSPREARQTMDEKDKQIQELTTELRNKKRNLSPLSKNCCILDNPATDVVGGHRYLELGSVRRIATTLQKAPKRHS